MPSSICPMPTQMSEDVWTARGNRTRNRRQECVVGAIRSEAVNRENVLGGVATPSKSPLEESAPCQTLRMGLFSRKGRQTSTIRKPDDVVVLCAFRDLAHRDPLRDIDPEHAHAYRWTVRTPPDVGTWAIVDGYDGPATVVVGQVGPNQYLRDNGTASLDAIRRLVPAAQLNKAATAQAETASADDAVVAAWLEHCRSVAGSSPDGAPAGFRSVSTRLSLLGTLRLRLQTPMGGSGGARTRSLRRSVGRRRRSRDSSRWPRSGTAFAIRRLKRINSRA